METLGEVDGLRCPLGHIDGAAQDEGVVPIDAVDILGTLDLNIDLGSLEPFGDHCSHLVGGPMLGGRGQQDLHVA